MCTVNQKTHVKSNKNFNFQIPKKKGVFLAIWTDVSTGIPTSQDRFITPLPPNKFPQKGGYYLSELLGFCGGKTFSHLVIFLFRGW